MRLNSDQLSNFLQQQKTAPSVFLLSGDEPYQKMEAADAVREFARNNSFTER